MWGRYFINAWAVHCEEMASASGVGDGMNYIRWGTARGMFN